METWTHFPALIRNYFYESSNQILFILIPHYIILFEFLSPNNKLGGILFSWEKRETENLG